MAHAMRLALILPAANPLRGVLRPVRKMRILNLSLLAALTPLEVEVRIIDEQLEGLDFGTEVDLVGITVPFTFLAKRAYWIADEFRRRGVKVVLGGNHVTVLPEEASRHADAVVVGEAEGVWRGLIQDFQSASLERTYRSQVPPELEDLPYPRFDLFNKLRYIDVHLTQTTRGCPYGCRFCLVTRIFGGKFRHRPVNEVEGEVERYCKRRKHRLIGDRFFFVDDNIVCDRDYTLELFSRLARYKIHWVSFATVMVSHDDELLALLQRSGCVALLVGFESLSQDTLKSLNKGFNKVTDFKEVICKLHYYRIGVIGTFIFGLDGDDPGVFESFLEFVRESGLDIPYGEVLVPYPGTDIYRRFQEEGRILETDWSKYVSPNVVFQPLRMSREELSEGYRRMMGRLYSPRAIFERMGKAPPGGNIRGFLADLNFRLWLGARHLRGDSPMTFFV